MVHCYVAYSAFQAIVSLIIRRERCTMFRWERTKERDNSEDQGVEGRVGSEWISERLGRGYEWIRMAQDRDRWQAVVDAEMNLRVWRHGVNLPPN
jgi:hypothetical protein